MRRSIVLALTGAITVASVLAGCGNDATTLPKASTTVAGSGDTTAGGDTMPADDTTPMSGDSDSDYCQLVRKYNEESTIFDDLFTTDTPDPAKMKAAFETMQGLIAQLVSIAPAEVKADAQIMGDATNQMIALIAKYDYDFTALLASEDANALNDLFASTEVAAASDHLDQYDQQVCGVSYDS